VRVRRRSARRAAYILFGMWLASEKGGPWAGFFRCCFEALALANCTCGLQSGHRRPAKAWGMSHPQFGASGGSASRCRLCGMQVNRALHNDVRGMTPWPISTTWSWPVFFLFPFLPSFRSLLPVAELHRAASLSMITRVLKHQQPELFELNDGKSGNHAFCENCDHRVWRTGLRRDIRRDFQHIFNRAVAYADLLRLRW